MGPTERSPLEPVNRLGTLWSSDQPRSVAVVSGREEYRRNCDGRRRDNICYDAPFFSDQVHVADFSKVRLRPFH